MSGPASTASGPSAPSAADRLDSWKEIAAHLKRDVRTVQRWEKEHALPIRRHVNARQGSVFAYKEELDAWWHSEHGELEARPARTLLDRSRLRLAVVLGLAGLTALAVGISGITRRAAAPVPAFAVSVVLPAHASMDTVPGGSKLALSSDGSTLAFVARKDGRTRLYIRRVDEFEAKVLPGTDDATSPFFSPDGRAVGFFVIEGIKRVSVEGGAPEFMFRSHEPEGGAAWQPDDTIVFSAADGAGLMRGSARGGPAVALTQMDARRGDFMHTDPTVLPGGGAILFTVLYRDKTGIKQRIDAVSLDTGERHTVLDDARLVGYVANAGLIFVRDTRVLVAAFDPAQEAVTAEPVTLLDDADDVAVTHSGMLAYTPGSASLPQHRFVWVSLDGREQAIDAPPRDYSSVALSPDGSRIATALFDGRGYQVWMYDLARSVLMPLFTESSRGVMWSPDGARVVVGAVRGEKGVLLWRPSDGSGPPEILTTECGAVGSFSRDGRTLFCGHDGDIWSAAHSGRGTATPFVQGPYYQLHARISPDSRWLAYLSDESGRWEVYITGLPGAHGKWQISTNGGTQPVWSRDGRALFYRGSDALMRVDVEPTGPVPTSRPPIRLFEDTYVQVHPAFSDYDVSPDGSRFLMVRGEQPERIGEIRILQDVASRVAAARRHKP